MRDDAHQTSESDAGLRASGAPAPPDIVLLRAAESALISLGRDVSGLQVIWTTEARAILLQEEPAPALFIKVYQEGTQLEREVATLERALAADIPVAKLSRLSPWPAGGPDYRARGWHPPHLGLPPGRRGDRAVAPAVPRPRCAPTLRRWAAALVGLHPHLGRPRDRDDGRASRATPG